MILLLDPFDSIVSISEDKNEFIKALSQKYFILSRLPNELLKKISEIEIVNVWGEHYTVDNDLYEKFIKKSVKKSDILAPLFFKRSIHNMTGIQDFINFQIPLLNENKQFIFFNTLLSNALIPYLFFSTNVIGYRLIKKDNVNKWMEIMDVTRYLDISYALLMRSINKESFFEYMNYHKKLWIENSIQAMIDEIETNNLTKHFYLSNDWEEDNQEKLLSALQNKYGLFELSFCKLKETFSLPEGSKRLIIYNFHYLAKEEQIKLLKDLFSEDYKESIVIIFSSEAVDLRGYPQSRGWLSSENSQGITESIYTEVFKMGKIIDLKIDEYENIINTLTTNNREKKKFNKRLNNFAGGGDKFNAEKSDFWYDLKSLELYNIESLKEWAISMFKKYIPESTKKKFVFTPEGNYWYIKVNETDPADKYEKKNYLINHTKNKAIRYLVYLIKHTTPNNPMSFAKLSKSISKWKTGNEVEVKYETFTESIGDLFKKYDFLKPIEKYLYYDKTGRGCYYQENAEILIDLTAIEIPFVQLKNKK